MLDQAKMVRSFGSALGAALDIVIAVPQVTIAALETACLGDNILGV